MYTPSSWLIWGRFHRKLDESGLSGESMGPRISYCGLECWAKTSWLCWELCFQSKASAGAGRPKRIRTETYYVYYIYNYIYIYIYIVICNMYTYTTIYNMYTYKYIYIYLLEYIICIYIYSIHTHRVYTDMHIHRNIFESPSIYLMISRSFSGHSWRQGWIPSLDVPAEELSTALRLESCRKAEIVFIVVVQTMPVDVSNAGTISVPGPGGLSPWKSLPNKRWVFAEFICWTLAP